MLLINNSKIQEKKKKLMRDLGINLVKYSKIINNVN